ncbi:hypothetical protein WAE58_04445 [Pedobacter panaciterrae]|uniref:Uncharacterized protein n=1 Tax=Pedobacter panaciterrae TaxID=363849 RepID=A0ABU8NHE8_9SPHI
MASGVNRAARLYENWESRQSELEGIQGLKPEGNSLLKLKYDFLREGLYRIGASVTEQEKLHLFALQTVVGKLQKQLYPNRLVRFFQQLKSAIWDRPRHIRDFEAKKAENIISLTALMKKTGMAGLSGKLEKALDYESPKTSISGMQLMSGQGKLMVALQLEKQAAGIYRATEYQVVWNTPDEQVKSCRIPVESGIDLSEAFNMLQGRAVFKGFEDVEGKTVRQWVQLDPKVAGSEKPIVAFLPGHGFDLKNVLQETAVQLERYGLLKEQTLRLLESGHQVGFELGSKGSFLVQANPGTRSLDFFDGHGKRVELGDLTAKRQEPAKEWGKELTLIPQEHIDQSAGRHIYR